MNPDPNGLPLPGRELDLTVARCLGYEIVCRRKDATSSIYVLDYGAPEEPWLIDTVANTRTRWTPSTSSAFFRVMEAMEKQGCIWDNWEKGVEIARQLHVSVNDELMRLVTVIVQRDKYPSREAAYAHAVCACVWKVRGGIRNHN